MQHLGGLYDCTEHYVSTLLPSLMHLLNLNKWSTQCFYVLVAIGLIELS